MADSNGKLNPVGDAMNPLEAEMKHIKTEFTDFKRSIPLEEMQHLGTEAVDLKNSLANIERNKEEMMLASDNKTVICHLQNKVRNTSMYLHFVSLQSSFATTSTQP